MSIYRYSLCVCMYGCMYVVMYVCVCMYVGKLPQRANSDHTDLSLASARTRPEPATARRLTSTAAARRLSSSDRASRN
jgi:hypothetical protein